jgi:tryptophanyl-tRNA synthetase
VPYQWLTFYLDDDERLAEIALKYGRGDPDMLTGHVKSILVDVLNDIIADFKRRRAAVTDDVLDAFMRVRQMPF